MFGYINLKNIGVALSQIKIVSSLLTNLEV